MIHVNSHETSDAATLTAKSRALSSFRTFLFGLMGFGLMGFGLMLFMNSCTPDSNQTPPGMDDSTRTGYAYDRVPNRDAYDRAPNRDASAPETYDHYTYNRYTYDLQGHRGARGLMPENTIPGFLLALDLGVTTLEMDLVVTADSLLLVSHEPWFHEAFSTTPDGQPVTSDQAASLSIFQMTAEDVSRFDVGLRQNPAFPEQQTMTVQKPLLKDVILAAETYAKANRLPAPRYNLETKSRPEWVGEYVPSPETFARLVEETIVQFGLEKRATVQSFDPATLIALRQRNPGIAQAMLIYRQDPVESVLSFLGFTPEIWSPAAALVTSELVANIHARGMKIIPWTINDPDEMNRLLDLGVDGIITDYPNLAPVR